MENRVYLIIGSNQGDKRMLLARAEELINLRVGVVQLRSSCYETEAWGFETEATFYNRVLDVDCRLAPAELLARCLDIEMCLGRERSVSGYASRTMDIDILFYNQEVVQETGLQIPHPRMHLRKFCLEPMNELAPCFSHPVLHKSMQQLLTECEDRCWVRKVEAGF